MRQKLGPNQKRWLRALESGKFKQTRIGALKSRSGGFCCLGVACELFKAKGLDPKPHPYEDRKMIYGETTNVAPAFVQRALGLRHPNGTRLDNKEDGKLIVMNDNGKRFKTIAAAVRKEPEQYFKAPK